MRVAIILCLLVVCGSLGTGFAAQCTPDQTNPCRATCNGTTLDITNLFDYPVKVSDNRNYTYIWSPCTGYPLCHFDNPRNDRDCAMCQSADTYYNLGHATDPIYIFGYNSEGPVYEIQYPWGVDWRMTVITFLRDTTQEETTVEFTGESPYLQYNFLVRGKCVGQPDYDGSCRKHYKKKT